MIQNINLVSSEGLADRGIEVRQEGRMPFGERMMGMGNVVISLTADHTEQIAKFAATAVGHMPSNEQTLARTEHDLPTLLSRVDCTIRADNTIYPYEVDDRPAGLGVSHRLMTRKRSPLILHSKVANHYRNTVGEMPIVVRYPSVQPNDDELMFKVVEVTDILSSAPLLLEVTDMLPSGAPLLIRSKLEDPLLAETYEDVVWASVAPILSEGDKVSYRVPMGHAELVDSSYEHDRAVPVVVKTLQGTRCNGVGIYLPPVPSAMYAGDSVLSYRELKKIIAKSDERGILIERYVPPIPTAIGKRFGGTILRVYVAHRARGEVEVLGGSYVSRPGPLVHGAEDALAGAVVVGG